MPFVDLAGLGDPRQTDHERSSRAVVIELGLGKGQRHAMVGQEDNHGLLRLSAFFQGIENRAQTIVGPAYAGVVKGEFLTNLGIIEEKAGDRHFVALEDPAGDVGVFLAPALATKRVCEGRIYSPKGRKASPAFLALAIPRAVDSP